MADDKNFDPWGSPQPPKKKPKAGGAANPGNVPGGRRNEEGDDGLRKFRYNTENLFGGGGDNKRVILITAGVVFGLWLVFGSIFFVASGEKGVVLRFGEYNRTVESGLNFKFPRPFEKAFIRNVENTNQVSIGEGTKENLMVTGDENIVDVEFVVRWNVKNLEDFLFNITTPEDTAKNAAESAMREIIGSEPMVFALGEGEGRAKITVLVQERLQKMLDDYKSGIRVVAVDLKKIDVPGDVVQAQIDVQNAKTEQQRVKNQAEAYRNDILPRARGDAAKMLEDAAAYKQSTVARAEGDASRFLAVYKQYRNAKEVTHDRIYIETMEEVMRGMDKVIIDDNNKVVPYMNINARPLPELEKESKSAETNAQ